MGDPFIFWPWPQEAKKFRWKHENPTLAKLLDDASNQGCDQNLAQFRFNLKLATHWILCFYLQESRIKIIQNINLATCRSTSASKLQIFCWFWHSPFTACRQACMHPLTLTNLFRLRTKVIQIFHLKLIIITRQQLRNTITSKTHRATIAQYHGIWKIIKLPFLVSSMNGYYLQNFPPFLPAS